jgi:hypothetical protein
MTVKCRAIMERLDADCVRGKEADGWAKWSEESSKYRMLEIKQPN